MSYYLLTNPAAGRGRAAGREERIVAAARRLLREVIHYRSNSPGDLRQYAEGLKNSGARIIVAGGDGSIHEVVNGLAGGNSTLGFVPVGSGNDFVKMLNIPVDVEKALQVIVAGNHRRVDVGKIGDRYFLNGVGIGFDAQVVIESQTVRHLRGIGIYLMSVLKTLRKYRNYPVILSLSDRQIEREIFMITVGNGQCQGGGFYLTPHAQVDDGQLDVCIFEALNRRQVLKNLPKAIKGRHVLLPQVEYRQTRKVTVHSTVPIPVHADGELLSKGMEEIEIEVVPAMLNVYHNNPGVSE